MDPHATFAEIGAKYELYCGELTAHGFPPPGDTPMARLVAVAATDDEAREIASAGAAWTIGAYANSDRGGIGVPTGEGGFAADVAARIDGYVDDKIVWGSPARVRDELTRLGEEMHLGYLMIAPLSHDSFVRFTAEVLPHL
jgi:alkanesulfonate monooxygenase SsuD/methylene tetrahydromethanopterin reductase-like flavin-dependent oxidoreductase (luciferase family)